MAADHDYFDYFSNEYITPDVYSEEKVAQRTTELDSEANFTQKIIALANVMYGALYPAGSTFDVITVNKNNNNIREDRDADYIACLIVFNAPDDLTQWDCVRSTKANASHLALEVLEILLQDMQNMGSEKGLNLGAGTTSAGVKRRS